MIKTFNISVCKICRRCVLTQMDNFGKLHMAASSIFVNAANSETVVALAWYDVTGDLS